MVHLLTGSITSAIEPTLHRLSVVRKRGWETRQPALRLPGSATAPRPSGLPFPSSAQQPGDSCVHLLGCCCFLDCCCCFFLNCPSPASVRCPVPLTQRSRQCGTARACAAESSTFPCWIRSDMCLLFLPPSLFSQDARLCACLCQRDACVKCRCVRSRSLPLCLSLSF